MTFSSPAKISAVQQKAQRRFYLFIENCRRNISLRQTLNSYSLCFIGSVNVEIIQYSLQIKSILVKSV